jgi:hypothetical protein
MSFAAVQPCQSPSPIRVSPASLPCRVPSSVADPEPVLPPEAAVVAERVAVVPSPEPVAEQVPMVPRRAVPVPVPAPAQP